MIKYFRYLLEAIFIYLFFAISKLLGLYLSRKCFSYIFLKIGPLFKSNKIVDQNLSIYSKNISRQEREVIKANMWKNYGMTFIEYIFLDKFKKKNDHIKINGFHILKDIIKNKKPVIFVSGHFANFELMSMELTKNNIELATIYRPLNNFFLNPLMEYLRKKYVCKNQIKKGISGVKESIQYINTGKSIALMIDQRVTEGEKIKFFNKLAHTTTLPAQIALKYNLEIVPIFIERSQDNFFNMKIFNPINISKFNNKNEITSYLNKSLEEMIKKNPNQWIWTHNRWK